MPELSLYFLGSPRVCLDGATVEMGRRKVVALLAYLAVTAQRQSRDELAQLLYGVQDREHGRANLRHSLSLLRSAIGEDRLGTDRLGVWLPSGEGLWVDTAEFRRLLERGQVADTKGDLATARSDLAAAVGLFRGDFLAGFYLRDSTDFEDWQGMVQEDLRRQHAAALQRLVEIHGGWGQYEQAIEYGRRRLALDPLEEAIHRELMRLHGLAGQHVEALRQYDRCRSVLERELGEEPDEKTERLREHIASRKPLLGTEWQREQPKLPQGLHQPKSLDSRPNNLPTQPTPFIGREEELAGVREALRLEEVRLLTLTGAGGTGKTRLALQAAAGLSDAFEQGVFFVDLAALRDPDHLIGAIAAALNVREAGGDDRSLLETLSDYLGRKQVLLALDNFEHLLPAGPQVAELLASCPQLKVMATSREALHLRAERVFPVPPMQLPSQGQRAEEMTRCEAVRLFADRAAAVRPTFELSEENAEVVAEICIRLDGLPLAIELAATQIGVLTPQALLSKLEDRLNLLKGGPRDLPERQQTLRSEIDWSHELLGPGERRIFRRLSVFPAGCTLEAAEAVCRMAGGDPDVLSDLSGLAEKSLVRLVEDTEEPRFRMLETIREYARERLEESGELDVLEPRFADYFLRLVEEAEPELYGPDQMRWFNRIEEEYGNIRAALAWLYDRQELVDGLRLAGALGWFWFRRARFAEGEHWLELFRAAASEGGPPGLRAKAAYALGWLKLCVGSAFWGNPEGKHFFRESLELWREAGHQRGIALSQVWLGWKGGVEGTDGWALADESVAIARETGDPWTIAWCLKVAYSHLRREDKELAPRRAALEEAVALARQTGDPFLLSQALNGMGNVFGWIGELEEAEPWYRDSLHLARQIDDSWSILDNINCLADVCLGLEQILKAKELFAEGLRLAMDLGARGYLPWFIGGFYGVARREGQNERAVRLGAFSEAILNPDSRYDPRLAEELGLDKEVAVAEWKTGQAMTLEQAVAYALAGE